MLNYNDYLQCELWKNKSKAFIKNAGRCDRCNSKKELNCHHLNYEFLGNETEKDIVVLCKKCHLFIHQNKIDYGLKRELLIFEKDIRWKLIKEELSIIWKK